MEATEEDLMQTIFSHLTLSEMMHESVLDAYGRANFLVFRSLVMSAVVTHNKLSKPEWIRVKVSVSQSFHHTTYLMRRLKLNSVCEEAACHNIRECWAKNMQPL
jgi:hypothetical protein